MLLYKHLNWCSWRKTYRASIFTPAAEFKRPIKEKPKFMRLPTSLPFGVGNECYHLTKLKILAKIPYFSVSYCSVNVSLVANCWISCWQVLQRKLPYSSLDTAGWDAVAQGRWGHRWILWVSRSSAVWQDKHLTLGWSQHSHEFIQGGTLNPSYLCFLLCKMEKYILWYSESPMRLYVGKVFRIIESHANMCFYS